MDKLTMMWHVNADMAAGWIGEGAWIWCSGCWDLHVMHGGSCDGVFECFERCLDCPKKMIKMMLGCWDMDLITRWMSVKKFWWFEINMKFDSRWVAVVWLWLVESFGVVLIVEWWFVLIGEVWYGLNSGNGSSSGDGFDWQWGMIVAKKKLMA